MNLPEIEEAYAFVKDSPGSIDIHEHMDTLRNYASKCETVTELGVRCVVSTWAFIAGKPKKLKSFDLIHVSECGVDINVVKGVAEANGVDFQFFQEDVLTTENIDNTDLLFIDTLHSYKQLKMELFRHADKVNKYLVFHDIVSFSEENEGEVNLSDSWNDELKDYYNELRNEVGINKAIIEFLIENKEWDIEKLALNNNGLMILKRRNDEKY